MQDKEKTVAAFVRLYDIVAELRQKCPWDRKQTFESLRTNTLEEVYELSDAIVEKRWDEVRKEAGDVMLHLMFYAVLGREQGAFTLRDILEGESEKLIRRHPHVYGEVEARDSETVKENWEKIKLREGNRSVLSGVPRSLPALIKAQRIQEKVRGVGFDWGDPQGVWDKVQEELGELRAEVERNDREKAAGELGDVLFSLINYAQHLGINAEDALESTNKKFIARFTHMEDAIARDNLVLGEMSLEQMDAYWDRAKKTEAQKEAQQASEA